MKRFMLLLFLCPYAFALQTPTITGIAALSDTSVQVSWHSDDAAILGFYVLRIDPVMSFYRPIDTLAATDSSYIDSPLRPAETYGYGVAAFSATGASYPTTFSWITLPGTRRIFIAPTLSCRWDTAMSLVYVTIKDNSTIETGYRVLRAENFGAFSELATLVSAFPALTDTILFTDNTAKTGAWYTYRAIVYNSEQKDSSETTVFTYQKKPVRTARHLSLGSKASDFPVRFGAWALKHGDTICVQQDSAPWDSCSLIDVSDKDRPVSAGRIWNKVPLRPQQPQSYTSLGNILLYRNGGLMVQYRFLNGAVDSLCSVPQYNLRFPPPGLSIGQVVGTVNNNVAVTRYSDNKYFYYDSHFFSQEKLVPLGTSQPQQPGFGFCVGITFLLFRSGAAHESWTTGFQNGATCDMGHPAQQYYPAFDFSFDPRTPVQTVDQNVPDTTLREYDGYLTSDSLIKKSRAVFVDSVRSLMYLFSDTMLSVFSFSSETGVSKQLQRPADHRLFIRYRSTERRLFIACSGAASATVKLFSLNGKLLFAREIGIEKAVQVPEGISGVVFVRVEVAGKRVDRKISIMK